MDSDNFSHFFRLGSYVTSATHFGEPQLNRNVEQEQSGTFSRRVTSLCIPENPYSASLYAGRAACQRVLTSSVTSSTVQNFPLTIDLPTPLFQMIDTSQPTNFEDDLPQLSTDFFGSLSSFGSFDEFIDTYLPKESEAQRLITSQPAGQTTTAPVMDSPVTYSQVADSPSQGQPKASSETAIETATEKITEQTSHVPSSFLTEILKELSGDPQETRQVSCQDNPPANPPDSDPGYTGEPAPAEVMVANSKPLNPDSQRIEFNDPWVIAKVRRTTRRVNPLEEFLWRTHSKERPYMCGFTNCGRTFKSSGHLTDHMFDHTRFSEHKCTYPECRSSKYFRRSRDLRRHIEKLHSNKSWV